MSSQNVSKTSKSLEGVRGVHVVSRSPLGFEGIDQVSGFESADVGTKQRLFIERVWQQRPPCLRPIHCSIHGDRSILETAANVITSIPFIFLGMQAPRKNLNMKVYANSLIGVGIASSLYHASRGKFRKYLRWADYTMIATATVYGSNRPPEAWMGTEFEPYGSDNSGLSMFFSYEFMKFRLYQLSPVEDLELGMLLKRPGSLFVNDLSKMKNFSDEGYGSVPRAFIVCKEDKAIPEEHQRWMIDNFPAKFVVEMEETDHMPMFSKPQQLCDHFIEIAYKFI